MNVFLTPREHLTLNIIPLTAMSISNSARYVFIYYYICTTCIIVQFDIIVYLDIVYCIVQIQLSFSVLRVLSFLMSHNSIRSQSSLHIPICVLGWIPYQRAYRVIWDFKTSTLTPPKLLLQRLMADLMEMQLLIIEDGERCYSINTCVPCFC